MYVCLCNGITDREAERAVASGARKPAQVYASLGARPQCGRCRTAIKEMLARGIERSTSDSTRSRTSLS
ncbi:MAG: hypothetical protein FJX66_13590 [Alphaproteobacteria bacterium]|nr:hypothetical protein [Alphaproteobacteria bacterium]